MLLVLSKKISITYINWNEKYRVTQILLTKQQRSCVVYSQKSTIGLLFKKTTQTCRKSVDKRNSHLTKSPFGVKFSFSISSKSNSSFWLLPSVVHFKWFKTSPTFISRVCMKKITHTIVYFIEGRSPLRQKLRFFIQQVP